MLFKACTLVLFLCLYPFSQSYSLTLYQGESQAIPPAALDDKKLFTPTIAQGVSGYSTPLFLPVTLSSTPINSLFDITIFFKTLFQRLPVIIDTQQHLMTNFEPVKEWLLRDQIIDKNATGQAVNQIIHTAHEDHSDHIQKGVHLFFFEQNQRIKLAARLNQPLTLQQRQALTLAMQDLMLALYQSGDVFLSEPDDTNEVMTLTTSNGGDDGGDDERWQPDELVDALDNTPVRLFDEFGDDDWLTFMDGSIKASQIIRRAFQLHRLEQRRQAAMLQGDRNMANILQNRMMLISIEEAELSDLLNDPQGFRLLLSLLTGQTASPLPARQVGNGQSSSSSHDDYSSSDNHSDNSSTSSSENTANQPPQTNNKVVSNQKRDDDPNENNQPDHSYANTYCQICNTKPCKEYFNDFERLIESIISRDADSAEACLNQSKNPRYLLNHCPTTADNRFTKTPLNMAYSSGVYNMQSFVRLLLEKGADPNILNSLGLSSLEQVADNLKNERSWNHFFWIRMIDQLLSHGARVSPENSDNKKNNILAIIVRKNNFSPELFNRLMQAGVNIDQGTGLNNPLYLACKYEHDDLFKTLIEHGVNPDGHATGDKTPLFQAVKKRNLETIRILLNKGAHPDSDSSGRDTPLYQAVRNGHHAIAELLLTFNADPDCNAKGEETALYAAAERNDEHLIRTLLQAGADINAHNIGGKTPLWEATSKRHRENCYRYFDRQNIIEFLLARGASAKYDGDGESVLQRLIASYYPRTPAQVILRAIESGANPDWGEGKQHSLYLLIDYKHPTTLLKKVLSYDVDPNGHTTGFLTPLYQAIWKNNKNIEEVVEIQGLRMKIIILI